MNHKTLIVLFALILLASVVNATTYVEEDNPRPLGTTAEQKTGLQLAHKFTATSDFDIRRVQANCITSHNAYLIVYGNDAGNDKPDQSNILGISEFKTCNNDTNFDFNATSYATINNTDVFWIGEKNSDGGDMSLFGGQTATTTIQNKRRCFDAAYGSCSSDYYGDFIVYDTIASANNAVPKIIYPNGGEQITIPSSPVEIDFNIYTAEDINTVVVDLNYSTTGTQGEGTEIITDTNVGVGGINCDANTGLYHTCHYSWDYSAVPIGDYYIGAYTDFNAGSGNYDASDASFEITTPKFETNVFDEETGSAISGATITLSTESRTTDASGYAYIDLNFLGATSSEYAITINASGYTERTLTYDLNNSSVIDQNTILLDSDNGLSIDFKMYKPDGATLFNNATVTVYNIESGWDKAAYVSKTSSAGETTFFLNPNDENYSFHIVEGSNTYDYNSVKLTIKKPKDEDTGVLIDGNWYADVESLAWYDVNNIVNDTNVFIFSDTADNYKISIEDNAGNYFSRSYYVSYPGNPTSATLQPYLVSIDDGLLTTVKTISAYTNKPVSGVLIDIYKVVPDAGRVYVAGVLTDDKGEGLVLLSLNEDYEFEITYDGKTRTDDITATSATIYVLIDDASVSQPDFEASYINVKFSPNRGKLFSIDNELEQIIKLTNTGNDLTMTNILVYVTNTSVDGNTVRDFNIYSNSITPTGLTHTNTITLNTTARTLDGNGYDDNGWLEVYVQITLSDGNVYTWKTTYSTPSTRDLVYGLQYTIKDMFAFPTAKPQFLKANLRFLVGFRLY